MIVEGWPQGLRQEAIYRAIFERSEDAILIANDLGQYVHVNAAACRLYGVEKEELLGKTAADFAPPEMDFEAAWSAFLEAGKSRGRFALHLPNGKIRTVDFNAVARVAPGYHLSILRDITEQLEAEQRLHVLSSVVEETEELVMITDKEGVVTYVNPAFEKTTGWCREEVLGRSVRDEDFLKSGHHPESFYDEMWEMLARGEVFQAVFVNRKRDGTQFREDRVIKSITSDDGQLVHYFSTGRDVTLQDAFKERLLSSQKMEALGRLAGGVSHDFNNLLTVILSYGSFALKSLDRDSQVRGDVQKIVAAAQRAEKVTRQLLSFSRRKPVRPTHVDVAGVVDTLVPMLQRVVGEHIQVGTVLTRGLAVFIDVGELEQVLLNLVVNARDAMPAGGVLRLEASCVQEAERGDLVCIRVADTGVGMDAEVVKHAIDPFFTTKAIDKGSGLGLSTCYGIIRQAGGFMDIESQVGEGTTVSLYLPRSQVELETVSQSTVEMSVEAQPGETILVVEDEATILSLAERILTELGYEVLVAENGFQAVEVLKRQGRVDLLLTDVVMPQMNGRELARRIRIERPDIQVLYMSGYTTNSLPLPGEDDFEFVEKPFSPEELGRYVRQVLDRGKA